MSRLTRITGLTTLLIGLFALFALLTRAASPAVATANFEPAQTNPIRISTGGTRLFAVNTANNSVSVFDVTRPTSPVLLVEIPVGVGPVSVNPRTDDEAWVVNQVSNTVSVISVSKAIVTDTIYPGLEPMDVVFAGSNQAYVSVSRSNSIAVFDTTSHALITNLPVFGGSPRAMAVSTDGKTVYAAFAISGNATTIIPSTIAPPPPPPLNKALPPPPQVGLIVAATDPNWKSYITFTMPDNDVAKIAVGLSPTVEGYYSSVGTINLGLAVNPTTGDLFVSNTDALNLTFFEPNLRGHWVNNRITRIEIANGQITPFDLNPTINYKVLPNPAALASALAQPTGVTFDPSGTFMYVAAYGTDRVAKVDTNGNVMSFVEICPTSTGSKSDPKHKRGPRGLALDATGSTLYSLNRISDSISVINTAQMTVSSEIAVGTDPESTAITQGRGYLYDAKLSGNGTGACASCHVDADMDHLAWNLGDRSGNMSSVVQNGQTINFHPMKGPMLTQTLRGLLNLSPYHWRGDFSNFSDFNVNFNLLMGGSELSTSDMNSFGTFINSILFLPNPNETLSRTLPPAINGGNPSNGLTDYLTIQGTGSPPRSCQQCHTTDPGPGSNRLILAFFQPQPMKDVQLRNIYQRLLYTRHNSESIDGFGFEHDGQFSTASDLLATGTFSGYTSQQKTDLIAYLLCFDTGTAPAVGFTLTLTAANVMGSGQQTDWTTLESQATALNADLIARGTIQGKVHGLLYQPTMNNYISDTGSLYTRSQLQGFIQSDGDTVSFMGVYPGTGNSD